ncbi:hypothetical protein GOBAR_DD07054 [Gossypium barbadense]|nr:hypothetical protein GOBAR_DD07054 [Gossypium barbadense]
MESAALAESVNGKYDSTHDEDEDANPNSGTGCIGSYSSGLVSHVSCRPESAYMCYTHHGSFECSYSGPHSHHSVIDHSSPSKAACVAAVTVRSMLATVASTTPSVVADPARYLDSGATAHMTSNPAQFTDSRPYHRSGTNYK